MSAGEHPPGADRPPRAWSRWLLALLFLAGVGAFYALGLHRWLSWDALRGNLDTLQERVREQRPLAALLFFLVYVAVTALSLPVAAPLSLLAGALFGRWLGTALVAVAATAGATLAFLSSRYLFRDLVQRKFSRRLTSVNEGVRREGAYYLFVLRLVPLFPFFLVNLGMGLTPLSVFTYAWVSLVGMLPGTFLYLNAGQELGELARPSDVFSWSVILSFSLLGVLPLLLRRLLRRFTKAP
jgi:uncharacterized membrane protein YdjX (TVP38/TMEM64 family)